MKGKLLTKLAVAVLGVCLAMPSAWAQGDLAEVLVGKWEGEVQWARGAGSATGDTNRTLIIQSVEQKDGKWVATGRYGVTGKGLAKVEIEVEESGGRPVIRFVTAGPSTVRLSLVGAKDLTGTMTITGASRQGNERQMKLEKKD